MRTGQGGDDLTQAYQSSRVLEGYDGLIFSDIGLGARVFPDHIKQARMTLRPGDPFYDDDNAHVLTPLRFDVEGLHVDVPPTALSKGLREWGWDTVPVRTRMRDSKRIITVGTEMTPNAQSAFVMGCPLAINPAGKTDAVAEVANRITPLNPGGAGPGGGAAPFMDLMNMCTGIDRGAAGGLADLSASTISAASGSMDAGDSSMASAGSAVSAPSFGSVATDLAVGGIAVAANATIKENAEIMKAKYDDLRAWCDDRFQRFEEAMHNQATKTSEISTQVSGVVAAQEEADVRARTAVDRQEHNQIQLMNMLQGLTQLATGGSTRPALTGPGVVPTFSFAPPAGQTSFLTPAEQAGHYGPTLLGGAPLPAPYAKTGGPPPPPPAGGAAAAAAGTATTPAAGAAGASAATGM